MSRIKPIVAPASKVLALMIAIALVVGPLSIKERVEEAVFAAWRAVGDQLAKRELTAVARQLDLDRQDAERIRASRESLATRLLLLETQRELVAAELNDGALGPGDVSMRELASLESAIAVLRSTAARADLVLRGARDDLRTRRVELSALQADDDARRVNQALAQPIGDPTLWSARVARARVILGPRSADHEERDANLTLRVSSGR